jgi:asparagine synthase (glutamine-hydrolysing)
MLDGTTLLVASEAKQIVAARAARPRANAGLVTTFLEGSRYPCLDESFFEGIHPLPPATWCEIALDSAADPKHFQAYWRLSDFHAGGNGGETSYGSARERFEALLRDAVRSHAVADVGVGALLSGGLDSSTIAALLAREVGPGFPTFSFGVRDGDPRLCELPYAEAVARAHGLVNHQAGLDADWVRRHAPAAIRALEEPPLALAALAQYRTFQLCREHGVTVVLDGQAADEVLGGYPYHQRLLLADRLRRGRWRDMRVEMGAIARREGVSRLRLLAALAGPPLARRVRRRPPWLAAVRPRRDAGAVRDARADRGHDRSALNRQLYWDVRWGNVKVVLGHTDRSSMAHSVEARVPYLDPALVELAFGMPDDFKVGNGQRKRVLRDTARDVLPAEVTDRPDRMGFALDAGTLMRALSGHARDAILDGGVLSAPCFERAEAHRMLERFAAGDDTHAAEVWRLYALALWAREFDVAVG